MKKIILFLGLYLTASILTAQTEKYWVYFTDKSGAEFDPYEYFDEKAIERREKLNLPLNDFTDLPVVQSYIDAVEVSVTSVSHHTRWFNALAVEASEEEIAQIRKLAFVKEVAAFPKPKMELASVPSEYMEQDPRSAILAKSQTMRMGRQDFVNAGIDGEGVRVAVFDAGFTAADYSPAFQHLRSNEKIIDTYDFVKNKKDVYLGSSHGTSVLSCITGIYPNLDNAGADTLGLATGAEFLLARTERALLEVFSEEENWLAALEWADKNGADIINSSLGYTGNRYTYEDMVGNGTLVSRAGNLAAKKGILVVNSAGNDGSADWNFIGAPADADSVLAIGGLNPYTGIQTSFSSVGPTFDYRFKPNVTAYGHVIGAKDDYTAETQGTSFSSPLMAGFAACAWQANPGYSNMELFHALEKGADLYPYFDYAHGYGVPMAKNFLDSDKSQSVERTFTIDAEGFTRTVHVLEPNVEEKELVTEFEKLFNMNSECILDYEDQLFYHFENVTGALISYHVINMDGAALYRIDIPENARVLRIYYEGFTEEIKL